MESKGKFSAKPFLKWAGGKKQLLPEIKKRYPTDLGDEDSFRKYCEPFVGGGAVLFSILSKYKFEEVLINDINSELVNTYTQIRDNVSTLISKLEEIESEYLPLPKQNRSLFYSDKRKRFNELKQDNNQNHVERASLFIFLNRTCFNGLFRVNSKGEFNVPMGSYANPKICDKEVLIIDSKLLNNVKINHGSYSDCFDFIDSKTFVYLDPPYRPLSATASFTSYTEDSFNDSDQIELGRFVEGIANKGAKFMLSNSDPRNSDPSDMFFDEIYSKFDIARVDAKRMINCDGKNRGNVKEILVTNYEIIKKKNAQKTMSQWSLEE